MRKLVKIRKTFLKPQLNLKSSNMYDLCNYEIQNSYNIDPLLKKFQVDDKKLNLNLEKENKQILNVTSPNDIDKFNQNLLNQKKESLKSIQCNSKTRRVGLVGIKLGMTSIFDKYGVRVPLTVLKIENNQVTDVKKLKEDRYLIQVGGGFNDKINLSEKGKYYKNNIPPKAYIKTFKVTPDSLLPIGYVLSIRHFLVGQKVDVQGLSKFVGTEGVMQRWGFKGLVNSHGCSLKHRAAGSIGNREFPARVWPGKKMAGKSGNELITCQSLLIYKTDYNRGLIYVKGAVPGFENSKISILDAEKQRHIQYPFVLNPTFIPEAGKIYENITTYMPTTDGFENYRHDNNERLGISDEEEEGPAEDDDEMEGGGAGGAETAAA